MDDLIGIIVLILYFVAAGAAGKSKKKKKAKRQAAEKRAVQFEQAFERMTSVQRRRVKESVAEMAQPEAKGGEQLRMKLNHEGQDPCHKDMLAHERPAMRAQPVTQTQLRAAAEGEDPCHTDECDGIYSEYPDSPIARSPIFDTEDTEAFARDVLRGVIMSEVLTRPAQRRRGAGMKRGA